MAIYINGACEAWACLERRCETTVGMRLFVAGSERIVVVFVGRCQLWQP